MNKEAIGIFDSGVGGLTVASSILKTLPQERIIYLGDTGNVPYGPKSPSQIFRLVKNIVDYLISRRVKLIVMACNTSSAIVLPEIIKDSTIPVVGVIKPQIKEALAKTNNGKIGVIANEVTVSTEIFPTLLKQIEPQVKVYQQACPLLVPLIEKGEIDSKETYKVLMDYLAPFKDYNIDTLLLSCTHYPYLRKYIEEILGKEVNLIDPAELVAQQVKEILIQRRMLARWESPSHQFYVTGDPKSFQETACKLVNWNGFPIRKIELSENILL